jgi:hypothetical protein
MKHRACLWSIATSAALVAGAHGQFTEAYGGLGRVTGAGQGEAPQGGFVGIVLGNQAQMPPEVVQDLAELNQALPQPARTGQTRFAIEHPINGRAVSVELLREPGEALTDPLGVWIWPNWREAGNVLHFDQYSRVRWLSNYHVWLMHRPSQGAWRSRVVDIRAPTQPFKFTGFKGGMLRVADNGRWACVTNKGTLVVGRLDINDEQWMTHVITVPVQEPIEDMVFLHNGSVLIVMHRPPQGEDVLSSFLLGEETATLVMTMEGTCHSYRSAMQDRSFFGYVPAHEEIGLFAVTTQGVMAWQSAGYESSGDERPINNSPSGKYARTQKRDFIGGIAYAMRRTPLADPNDPLPEDHPNTTGSIWLSWAP